MKKTQKVMACSFIMLFTLFPAMSYALVAYTMTTPPGQNQPLTPQTGLNQFATQATQAVGGAPAGVVAGTPSSQSAPTSTTTTLTTSGPASVKTTTKTGEEVTQQKVTTHGTAVEEDQNIPPSAEPVTLRQIAELMIYESNITHGECACPYSPDRIGGQCGSESKYYKPHSDKMYCYYSDMTNKDIYFFWLKNGIGITDYY
jgi:hypothetical protein